MPEKVLSSSTGISQSLLDQISLQEYDVIQGKKYIGSDGTLHTGSLEDRPNDVQCPVVTQYDPGTGFVYLAIPRGAYRRTDGRMSPHPNMKRRLSEIMGEAGIGNVQAQFKTASFNLSLNSGGVSYGEVLEKWWSPGGTVIGMTKCQIRTDTESGEASANWTRCTVENGQIHFVNSFTHRGGQAYAEGTVVYF